MATGEVVLPAAAWVPADGSASHAAPASVVLAGSQSAPHGFYRIWAFDPGTDEHIFVSFRMPANYASGGTLNIDWTTNDVGSGENPVWAARVSATTAADADTPLEHAFSTAATVSDTVNTTEARRLIQSTITLNMDSAAAGDLITILFYRDADAAGDDLSSDAEFWGGSFTYTTT